MWPFLPNKGGKLRTITAVSVVPAILLIVFMAQVEKSIKDVPEILCLNKTILAIAYKRLQYTSGL